MSTIVDSPFPDDGDAVSKVSEPGYRIPAIAWLTSAVLARSAFSHFANPYSFLAAVYDYRLVGRELGFVLAALFPFVEIALAFILITGMRPRLAAAYSVALFGVFTLAQLSAVIRGLPISCGCFGTTDSESIGWGSLLLVVACLGLNLHCLFFSRKISKTA